MSADGTAPTLSVGVIAGIAAGAVGISALIVCVIVLIIRAKRKHRRIVTDLENRGVGLSRGPSIAEISDPGTYRTRTVLRRNTGFIPYGANDSGWDSLHSNDSFHTGQAPGIVRQPHHSVDFLSTLRTDNGRSNVAPRGGFHWPFTKRNGMKPSSKPTAAVSRLSAITEAFCESPRSQPTPIPVIPDPDQEGVDPFGYHHRDEEVQDDEDALDRSDSVADQQRASSPLLHVPARPAMKPAALFSNPELGTIRLVQGSRSKSTTNLPTGERHTSAALRRPAMHQRSTSLCTQKSGHVPSAPVPPLPAHISTERRRSSSIQVSPARMSASSVGSGGSSILVHSPGLAMKHEHSLRLLEGATRDWKKPFINGPRPMHNSITAFGSSPGPRRHHTVGSRGSIRSSIARYSGASFQSLKPSRANSVDSSLASQNRLSSDEVLARDKRSSGQFSSLSSPDKLLRTPISRRSSRFMVDERGSPSARCADYSTPKVREDDNGTLQASASRTSAGSWTFSVEPSPVQASIIPSALKGSPNGRKDHRRQNCVRISLAPTILGPSPPRMKQIQEEDSPPSESGLHAMKRDADAPGTPIHSSDTAALKSEFQSNATWRCPSNTASSPSQSLINFCQDNNLPLDHLGLEPNGQPRPKCLSTTSSIRSSALTFPSLPSPSEEPTKRTYPKTEEQSIVPHTPTETPMLAEDTVDEEQYQDALTSPLREDIPSITATPDTEDVVAAFLSLSSDDSRTASEDFSPHCNPEMNSSPPSLLTSRSCWNIERSISPRHLSASSSPVSPKSQRGSVSIACILPVTEPVELPKNISPTSAIAEPSDLPPVEPQTPDSKPNSAAPSRSTTIIGPRTQPTKALGKTVQMLRRMNSDVGRDHRAERRYLSLGNREASPTIAGSRYHDSYADFSVFRPRAIDFNDLVTPTGGLSAYDDDDDDLDIGSELDIDEMLSSSNRASKRKADFDDSYGDSLSWLDSDDTNPWGQDSGKPSPAKSFKHLPGQDKSHVQGGDEAEFAGDGGPQSIVWDKGSRFWEQADDLRPPRSPRLAPVTLPGLGAASSNATSGNMTNESFNIPGLSLTTASPSMSPEHATATFFVAPPDADQLEVRTSWVLGTVTRKSRPQRANTMRKSAILNLSSSAHNRQRRGNATDEGRSEVKTPEPNDDVREKVFGTPGSLYDEDGFLKL